MSLDVSFEDGMVIPETHFPIMHDKIIDDIDLLLVRVHVQRLDGILHEEGTSLLGFILEEVLLALPHLLVLLVPLDVAGLLCYLDLLLLVQVGEEGIAVYRGREWVFGCGGLVELDWLDRGRVVVGWGFGVTVWGAF
jgi:hypothetical protein